MDLRNRVLVILTLSYLSLSHYCQAWKCKATPIKQDANGNKHCEYKDNDSAVPLEVQLGAELITPNCQTCTCTQAGLECCEGPSAPSQVPAGCKAILKNCKYVLVMQNDNKQECVQERLTKPINKDQVTKIQDSLDNQKTLELIALLQKAVELFKNKPQRQETSTMNKPWFSQPMGNSLMPNQGMSPGFMGNSFVPQQMRMGYMGHMPMQQGYNYNPMYYQGYGMGYMGNYMQPQGFGPSFMGNPYFPHPNAFHPKRPQSTIDYADIEYDPAAMMRMMNPLANAGGMAGMLSGIGGGSPMGNSLFPPGMDTGALAENPLMMQLMKSAMAKRANENLLNNRLASLSNAELQTLVDILNPTDKVPAETTITTTAASQKQLDIEGNRNLISNTHARKTTTELDSTAASLDLVPTTTSPNVKQNLLDLPGKDGKSANSLGFMDYTLMDSKASANSIWI